MKRFLAGGAALGALLATGCLSNPYAVSVGSIDYSQQQSGGAVTFADPKVYRREGLINERRDELEYLQTLLVDSRDPDEVKFEPEIIRELEQVTALAAAFGFNSDPAAGLEYRQNQETAGIAQEIDTLKLQLQLEQLQRDVELWREKFAAQTDPSTDTLPAPGAASGAEMPSAKSADQLATAITALRTSIDGRFAAQVSDPRGTKPATNPIDAFQQRAAYRNLLQGAINASSLDEVHDANGAALLRLSFSATVLPPRDKQYSDTFGMLRMTVTPPSFRNDKAAQDALYLSWLDYVNASINESTSGDRSRYNPRLVAIGRLGEFFDLRYLLLPAGSGAECKPEISDVPSAASACRSIAFATPLGVTAADLNSLTAGQSGIEDIDAGDRALAVAGEADLKAFKEIFSLKNNCTLNPAEDLRTKPDAVRAFADSFQQARSALTTLPRAEQALVDAMNANGVDPSVAVGVQGTMIQVRNAAQIHLQRVQSRLGMDCFVPEVTPKHFVDFLTKYDDPKANKQLEPYSRITVYQVGPREESQTVSTVARAADALALAASASAARPASGQSLSGAMSFSRSAMGKVDALERAPVVVAFAEAALDNPGDGKAVRRFGWLLGPKMSVDAKRKALVLDHRPVPHDLFADLSLPGWWPYFTITSEAVWAPEWSADDTLKKATDSKERKVKVWLSPTNADLAGLTTAVAATRSGLSVRKPVITGVSPKIVSRCSQPLIMRVWGENLWRTNEVIVGGRLFTGESVRVLPDMSGVRVAIDKFDFPSFTPGADGEPASLDVTVLTPSGPAETSIEFEKSDDDCDKSKKEAPAPAAAARKMSIASVSPLQVSICDPSPAFLVTGNLPDELAEARFGTVRAGKGDFEIVRKGTEKEAAIWSVEFKNVQLKNRLAGLLQWPLSLTSRSGEVVSQQIMIVNATCQ